MGSPYDLLILPLVRSAGQERTNVPGLYVPPRPRRTARFRSRDNLVLHLTLDGNSPLPADQIDQILTNLAKTYFNTAGTITKAQRAVAEALNQYLLDRNQRNASTGRQAVGYLSQIVLRDQRLAVAQSGLSHAFHISAGNDVEHVHDLHLAGNGLGLSRTTHLRYSQFDLQPNDAMVIAIQPPANWTVESLKSIKGQGPESFRRKLLSLAGSELMAFLLQAQPGSGELRVLRPASQPRPVPVTPVTQPKPAETVAQSQEETQLAPETGSDTPFKEEEHTQKEVREPELSIPTAVSMDAVQGSELSQPADDLVEQGLSEDQLTQDEPQQPKTASVGNILQSIGQSILKVFSNLAALIKGILPDADIFTLPPSTMAFTAIAVPLVIVAVAAVVYFQRGRAVQYDAHFSLAQTAAAEAELKTDPQDQRLGWEATLAHLDNAELYQSTTESKEMRLHAQGILDNLDAVDRLEFRSAIIDQLDEAAQITRIVASEDGLYLLDSGDGVVERAILTNDGYQIDTTFQCGPGPYGGYIVGPIIDIAPIPKGDDTSATIFGIDANGNLLRCIPGGTPLASPMEPPDIHWGTPRGIAVFANDLYVLDPQTNAVWIYRGLDVTQSPRLFFDQQIPSMVDVIDLEIYQNDLYLLHEDGHLTTCVFSALAGSPTRCKDPEIFTDPRMGRQSGPIVEGAFFSQILFSPPPEPTIYMLDPNSRAVYRFSVRLTLDRQLRPQVSLSEEAATAFTIDRNNHAVFLAFGDQVYYAPLP